MRLSTKDIDREAARWALKLDAGPLAPDEERALDAWIAADVRHLGAVGRALASLSRVDRLAAVGPNALPALTAGPRTVWTRRLFVGGGTAGLAAAIAAGVLVWNEQTPEEFATKIGETCIVNLSDGSVVTLNTDTKLKVALLKQERRIELVRGEAMFQVAKDKHRPFIVTAAQTQVRAIGTAFNVQLLPQRPVQILVQEGVVEVTRRDMPDIRHVRAGAGTKAVVSPKAQIATTAISTAQLSRDLAWRRGQLEFNNETLATAAEAFARYSGTRIAVDPAVADRTITGSYAANDPAGFVKTAAAVLDLRYQVEDGEVRISR